MKKTTKVFMEASLERAVCSTAIAAGFSVSPAEEKSFGRHHICLIHGLAADRKAMYIDRSRGLSSGKMRVVIDENSHVKLNAQLIAIPGVEAAINRQSGQQIFQSSNYLDFRNKGSRGRSQHWGYGYDLPANDGLNALRQLLLSSRS